MLASGNAGKLREFDALLGKYFELEPQSALGISGAEETGATFEENAIIKARAGSVATGLFALSDDSGSVRVIAAQALGEYGDAADLEKALPVLLEAANLRKSTVFVAILALNAIDALDHKAISIGEDVFSLPGRKPGTPRRVGGYAPQLLKKIKADWGLSPGSRAER